MADDVNRTFPAVINYTKPYSVEPGGSITVSVDGVDYPYGRVSSVSMDPGSDGGFLSAPENSMSWTAPAEEDFDYKTAVQIEMSDGLTVSDTIDITIFEPLIDYDGNEYKIVKIGDQVWTAENFRGTHYNDGSPITNVTDGGEWNDLTTGARCYYNNDSAQYADKYGALYNWHAVNTGKLAPEGWHVPTDAEWTELENYLIANGYNWDGSTSGDKTGKSPASKTDWISSGGEGDVGNDLESNNRAGFTALPGGFRSNGGDFYYQSNSGYWWSSTASNASYAYSRSLYYTNPVLYRSIDSKDCGFSVRFVRD